MKLLGLLVQPWLHFVLGSDNQSLLVRDAFLEGVLFFGIVSVLSNVLRSFSWSSPLLSNYGAGGVVRPMPYG